MFVSTFILVYTASKSKIIMYIVYSVVVCMMETDYMMTRLKESAKPIPAGARSGHDGNTEEENNGYVVFK
jgi:hypothetical protein